MQGFLRFLTYNNAVPIALAILVLGAGSTFAAVDPDAIYSSDQQVVSVDNSYIVNKDLASYSPQARITSVTEDGDNYYVAYQFYTIDLEDGAWRDVVKNRTMSVSKSFLGEYRDLGLYVTEQLKQNVDAELARLRATQDIEKKNVTQKIVATTYGGLIGKMLDTATETLPGYVPVVAPPRPASDSQTASAGASSGSASGSQGTAAQIGLQLLGNNPAVIPLRTSYSDLGAVLIDPLHQNVGIHVFQNGVEVSAPTVDTSTTSVAAIEYRATDHNGTTVMVRRIVLIGGAADPGGEITSAGNTEPNVPVSVPAPTPAPAQMPPTAVTGSGEQAQEQEQAPGPDTSNASSTSTAASSTGETADGTASASTQATSTPADDDAATQAPEAATSSAPEGASSTPAL
jgi:hypothetical protein